MKNIIFIFCIFLISIYNCTSSQKVEDPTYVIAGNQENQLKGEVNKAIELVENSNVYIKYRLKFKWNVYDRSSPFQYYCHNPAIFFQLPGVWNIDFFRIIPYEHESNGLAGWDSQSVDRYFGESQLSFGKIFNFGIHEKVGGYYGYTHREGILTYRRVMGFFNTELFFQIKNKHGFIGHERIYIRGEWTKKCYWMEAGTSFRIITASFSPNIYIQYYRGYGEFINRYWEKTKALRAGLIFYN